MVFCNLHCIQYVPHEEYFMMHFCLKLYIMPTVGHGVHHVIPFPDRCQNISSSQRMTGDNSKGLAA